MPDLCETSLSGHNERMRWKQYKQLKMPSGFVISSLWLGLIEHLKHIDPNLILF